MSSRRHPASLIPIAAHDPSLVALMHQHVSIDMVAYVANQTRDIIQISGASIEAPSELLRVSASGNPTPPLSPVGKGALSQSKGKLPALEDFLGYIVAKSNLQVATLLTTVIYLHRLREKLPQQARGVPCTRHRVLLAAVIVAAKYLNDSSPKNKHWAVYGRHFDNAEVNVMEMQLLSFLQYDLRFDEASALRHFAPFLKQARSPQETRAVAVEKVQRAGRARSQALSPPESPLSALPTPSPPSLPENDKVSLGPVYLSVPDVGSRPHLRSASVPAPENYSAISLSSQASSNGESEMGSLVDDSGSSSSESELEEFTDKERGFRKFVLRPIPAYGYRTADRVRGSTMGPGTEFTDLTVKSVDHLGEKASFQREVDLATARRLSKIGATVRGPRSYDKEVVPVSSGYASSGASFLSRMWGAATRAAFTGVPEERKGPPLLPEVHIVDVDSSDPVAERLHPLGPRHAPGSMSRSRSPSRPTVLRAQATDGW